MNIKAQKIIDFVSFAGKKIGLWLPYDFVLDCFAIFQRGDLDDFAKLDFALCILTKNNPAVTNLHPSQKASLYQQILTEKIQLNQRQGKPGPKTVDFTADFDLIYAAFLQQYGIDLVEERGKLPWASFFMQFQGLSGTKMNEVMQLRAQEIPAYTPYNQKEIQNLIELKQYWALPPDETLPDNYTEQVSVMFNTLKQLAGGD